MIIVTRLLIALIVILSVLILNPVVVAETLTLVPTTQSTLADGTVLLTTITVESDDPSVMTIMQEVQTTDSLIYWKLVTTVSPDTDNDDSPEITNLYTAPKEPNPFDINQDGTVNGRDFWALFVFVFWTP